MAAVFGVYASRIEAVEDGLRSLKLLEAGLVLGATAELLAQSEMRVVSDGETASGFERAESVRAKLFRIFEVGRAAG